MLNKVVILSMFFTLSACSVETMNVGEDGSNQSPEPADKEPVDEVGKSGEEAPAPSEEEDAAASDVTVKTTTTTTTEVKVGEGGKPARTFQLVNQNAAVEKFVSQNYCRGSNLHDCWIKSGTLTEKSNGVFVASIEFWDTAKTDEPYTVIEQTLSVEGTMLLTTDAKLPDDAGIEYRMLWAVIDPVAMTLDVVYDWSGDGPQAQGDDLVQSFEFVEKTVD